MSQSSYSKTLSYLYSLQWRGMKFGLRNVRSLLDAAGHPERRFPSIHIAGTNGKGSTASYLASIATEAGYRTGLYTSPHLLRFTERIRIDGQELSEKRLVYYIDGLRPAIESVRATFFEATTAVAFLYFADEDVDLAVIETGLGGRFDATNIVVPLVSVITNIAFDHTEFLGTTLRAIAREKGGIIKTGAPLVTGATNPQVMHVFRTVARRKKTQVYRAGTIAAGSAIRRRNGRAAFRFSSGMMKGETIDPGLAGTHQVQNARVAVAACDLLLRRNGRQFRKISKRAIRRGVLNVARNTGLRGRLETIKRSGTYFLDVAHNPDGIQTLIRALPASGQRPSVAVFGVMKDKDHENMLRALSGVVDTVVTVAPKTGRALKVQKLTKEAQRMGLRVIEGGSVQNGLRRARKIAGPTGAVLVTGSHYVVAEALAELEKKA